MTNCKNCELHRDNVKFYNRAGIIKEADRAREMYTSPFIKKKYIQEYKDQEKRLLKMADCPGHAFN